MMKCLSYLKDFSSSICALVFLYSLQLTLSMAIVQSLDRMPDNPINKGSEKGKPWEWQSEYRDRTLLLPMPTKIQCIERRRANQQRNKRVGDKLRIDEDMNEMEIDDRPWNNHVCTSFGLYSAVKIIHNI